jgi:hypothetical protein
VRSAAGAQHEENAESFFQRSPNPSRNWQQ